LVIVEANGPGIAVIQKLEENGIRNQYTRRVFDKIDRTWVKRKGWKTTNTTRDILIEDTRVSLMDPEGLCILDRETIKECMTFRYNPKGKAEHSAGKKDDRVFGVMLALQGRKTYWREATEKKEKYKNHPDAWVWKKLERMCEQAKFARLMDDDGDGGEVGEFEEEEMEHEFR